MTTPSSFEDPGHVCVGYNVPLVEALETGLTFLVGGVERTMASANTRPGNHLLSPEGLSTSRSSDDADDHTALAQLPAATDPGAHFSSGRLRAAKLPPAATDEGMDRRRKQRLLSAKK